MQRPATTTGMWLIANVLLVVHKEEDFLQRLLIRLTGFPNPPLINAWVKKDGTWQINHRMRSQSTRQGRIPDQKKPKSSHEGYEFPDIRDSLFDIGYFFGLNNV